MKTEEKYDKKTEERTKPVKKNNIKMIENEKGKK